MRIIELTWMWLQDPNNWTGTDGIPHRLGQHLYYTLLSLAIAIAVAIPLGLIIGHTGRGGFVVVNAANAARALPTVGILVLVVTVVGIGLLPVLAALIALAIPSILVNTYTGIQNVDASVVDASKGMGMRGGQILRKVEVPIALPLILLGVRIATIQIVSTATIAAYVGLGGLGRYIFDGLARRDYPSLVGGAVLVVLLALLTEAIFVLLEKLLVSAGLRRR